MQHRLNGKSCDHAAMIVYGIAGRQRGCFHHTKYLILNTTEKRIKLTWKKFFKTANVPSNMSPLGNGQGRPADVGYRNYQSNLPEVYTGHPNRTERYQQYISMDADSEVNAALDILAEFCTQKNLGNNTAFSIHYKDKPTDNEVNIIKEQLQQWVALNEFNKRIFKIFRNTIKYGDQVFIRDPETFKLYWTEMEKVTKVIVDEANGKKPEQYLIKDINPNFQNLTVTAVSTSDTYSNNPQNGGAGGGGYVQSGAPFSGGSRFTHQTNEAVINAEHIVHISLTEGLDAFWPFGTSVLESIFKVFKQKELLEDSIIIYRVQRAPERRIFKIDVGNMPTHMAMAFVDRVKNEVAQRRIPTQGGGGSNMMDATYSPLCLDLETKIPLLDGRTLTLNTLIAEFEAGKENWAYSCDPITGAVVPGVINWAGVTRRDTEVIEITMDNGKTLTCTPDHKIPVFGKGFVEAKDLTVDDSLIAFNTRNKSISGGKTSEYQQVWDHETKSWVWTHRMVGEFFRKLGKNQEFTYLPENVLKPKAVIHHKDSDRFNNDPRNLTYMNKEDHIIYHSSKTKDFWKNMTDEYRAEYTSKISKTTKENWEKLSEEERLSRVWTMRVIQKQAVWMRQNDPVTAAKYKKSMGESRRKYLAAHPAVAAQCNQYLESSVKIKNQELTLTFEMLQEVVAIVKTQSKKKAAVILLCDNNEKLLELVKNSNSEPLNYKNAQCKIDFTKFGYSKLARLIKQFGYSGWKHFVKESDNFNHRIVSIKQVSNRDTGTITIDGNERWHNHHTFAIDSGIFVKNSQNEDFFFPVTADGRGSTVETLPGGCYAMDTAIPLLDGRTLTLTELTKEYKVGKQNWAYSANPATGEIVPGIISWAGVTHKSAKVVKLTLDNGKTLIVTPDHKFPIIGKGEVRADALIIGESFIPFNTRNTQLYQNHSNTWQSTSCMVNDYLSSHDTIDLPHCSLLGDSLALTIIDTAELYNHKLVAIEYLDDEIEVGTLTIDVDEVLHDYHNFALSVGIFGKNSNLNEVADLRFFTNKLFRGLRIPSSYLPTGVDEGAQSFSDGKTGTALIQEWRFNQYCKRLQNMIADKLDQEFKMFLRWRGINIDGSLFDLIFEEPQNFAAYAQADADTARIATFTQLEAYPYFSKRWLMKRYLGLTEQEMNENEQQWNEEQGDVDAAPAAGADLRSVGVTPGGIAGDLGNLGPMPGEEMGGMPGEAPGAPPAGGGMPAAAPPM